MPTMNSLIKKAGEMAVLAESVGLDDMAAGLRAEARLFREIRDDLRKREDEAQAQTTS